MNKRDSTISYTAILISAATLILFLVQLRLQYQESRLSVIPRLTFHSEYKSAKKIIINQYKDTLTKNKIDYTLFLINKGLGPAILKQIEYRQKGKKINLNELRIANEDITDLLVINNVSEISNEAILSKNEKLELFTITVNEEDFLGLLDNRKKILEDLIDVKIEYESIYSESFIVNLE